LVDELEQVAKIEEWQKDWCRAWIGAEQKMDWCRAWIGAEDGLVQSMDWCRAFPSIIVAMDCRLIQSSVMIMISTKQIMQPRSVSCHTAMSELQGPCLHDEKAREKFEPPLPDTQGRAATIQIIGEWMH
jgi:hypothetical protein